MHALSFRRMMLITAAVALSLATAMIVRAWVDQARTSAQSVGTSDIAKPAPKKILVASHPLPAGQFLKADDLQWQEWPSDNLAPTYVLEGTRPLEDFTGAVVRQGIAQGEPVTEDRLIKKGERGFLSAVMSPGTRAVTLALQPNAGLGGLVLPGDHVDVMLTAVIPSEVANQPERRATETVLEDIRVIAIDQKMGDMSSETVMAHTATLEVTPKQAEILALVTDMGKLSLDLRSIATGNEKPVKKNASGEPIRSSVTWDNEATNLGLKPHALPVQQADTNHVDVTRGSETKSFDFQRGAN